MLTVMKAGKDTCLWCAKDKDGLYVQFSDGSLKGFLCKGDFFSLVKKRSNDDGTTVVSVPDIRQSNDKRHT